MFLNSCFFKWLSGLFAFHYEILKFIPIELSHISDKNLQNEIFPLESLLLLDFDVIALRLNLKG